MKMMFDTMTARMKLFAAIAFSLTLPASAMSVEVFRYRQSARDGGALEYSFETDEPELSKTVTKEKAAEIAADFMTAFYHVNSGVLEIQVFGTQPVPYWLICFSDGVMGPLRQLYFVVVLPDGTVVEPKVEKKAN
jgi:hypothetical protein